MTVRRGPTIARLIAVPFPVSPRRKRKPELDAVVRRGRGAPDRYEGQLFRYLSTHGRQHGIASVRKLGNVLIDGTLILKDGRCLVIETKYRMGWLKATPGRMASGRVPAIARRSSLPAGRCPDHLRAIQR